MPIKKAAYKQLRKSHQRRQRNVRIKQRIQKHLKEILQILENNQAVDPKLLIQTISIIDKAARKGMLKKNTAARKKSRLMKRVNTKRS